jgi:hypothetical protein
MWLDRGGAFSPPSWSVLFNRTVGSPAAPAPRKAAAGAVLGERLYIVGGLDNSSTQLLQDSWSFGLSTREWRRELPVRGLQCAAGPRELRACG